MAKRTSWDKYQLILPCLNGDTTVAALSRSKGISVRTLHHWLMLFKQNGPNALMRSERKDKGKPRILSQEFMAIVQAYALQKPPMQISMIHKRISMLAKNANCRVPSYETVYGIVRKIKPDLLTLAHGGSNAYRQKFELIFRRECSAPNEIWQSDHTQLDIYVVTPQGKEYRPWLTIIMDDFSRAITGVLVSLEAPSAMHTAVALRRAIWKKASPNWIVCGIPQILYTDHGTDFTSTHIEQVCLALKIRMVHSAVGRPQGRGKIERFFQTLNECVLVELPGYTIGGKPISKPSLSLQQLETAIINFVLDSYHVKDHPGTGASPIARWGNGFLPQLPESCEWLDLLLLTTHKARKVQRDGIRFHGLRYIAATLAGFIGTSVMIRYDPNDLAEIKVYFADKFICTAICQELAGIEVGLKEIQAARSKIKKELRNNIRQSEQVLHQLKKSRENGNVGSRSVPKLTKQPIMTLKLYENE